MIDDCSTDNTKEILDSYGDKAVSVISGITGIWEQQVPAIWASGSKGGCILHFLDADDWWAEGKLREQLELLGRQEAYFVPPEEN